MNKNQISIKRIIDLIIAVLFIINLLLFINTGLVTYIIIFLVPCIVLGICRKVISKSQKFINKEMDGKGLDNRCIRCDSTKDLVLYSHGKKIAYTCPKCKEDFDRWNRNDIFLMFMYLIFLAIIFICAYLFIGSINDPNPILMIAYIPPLLAIITYCVNFKHNSSENKPKQYFRGG